MDRNSKTARKKSEPPQKKASTKNSEPPKAPQILTLDEKFLLWKKNSKPFKQFTFLDAQLFSEYLNADLTLMIHPNNAKEEEVKQSRLKIALKYSDIINYIEQHCDKEELEAVLSNVAFAYNIGKDVLKKEVGTKKIKKASKKISMNEFFQQLIDQSLHHESPATPPEESPKKETFKKEKPIQILSDSDSSPVEFLDREEWKIITTRGRTKTPQSANGLEQDEEIHPVKKKLKNNASKEAEPIYDITKFKEDDINELMERKKKVKLPSKKSKTMASSLKKTTSASRKIESDQEKVAKDKKIKSAKNKDPTLSKPKKKAPKSPQINGKTVEQHMELYINNEVDSDDGEGFSFFYVTQNIFNKTENYFQKKMKPEHKCSCVGGCNDPTICACARYNFENSGKSSCYIYDTKYGKKRLINQLIRKDMHIYECSSECGCTKSLCFNSCLNEGDVNKPDLADLIVERYKKVYEGDKPELQGFFSKMWGLKTRVFIPANALVLEYCGEVITKKEADRRGEKYDSVNCNYLFDLNKHAEIEKVDYSTNKIILNIDGVCETRSANKHKDISENFPLAIDAFFYGNHSRFVNHSCSPNMVAIAVHTENRNILLPRIVFFALKDIHPGEELTIDYNCAPLKDLKHADLLICLCGAPNCRGYVYEEDNESTNGGGS